MYACFGHTDLFVDRIMAWVLYNCPMSPDSYEIRICESCGLRYPLVHGHSFGARCPACMGETRVLLSRELVFEPGPTHPLSTLYKQNRRMLAVLLDNIRSAWNVGSILRSADGFGFDHAYLCGITPTPDGPAREAVTKTSLGAEDTVSWSYYKDAVKLVRVLKKEGWKVIALENVADSKAIQDASISTQRTVLILGNEVTGIDPELLELCDAMYHIPMHGEKKSFNVAIAFGIAAYALR